HFASGLGLFAFCSLVVVFVADYILRPKLVGTRIRMNDLLVFIAIFGGVEAFGFLGVVVGPLAVAVFLSIVRIYQREYRPGCPPRPSRRERGRVRKRRRSGRGACESPHPPATCRARSRRGT